MPQAILKSRSIPKVVRVNAGDGEAVLYKNLGNGRRVPFLWGNTVTLASGTTEVLVSSGVEFNDHKVADGVVLVTPLSTAAANLTFYIDKDTANNVVKVVSTAAPSADVEFDILVFMGDGVEYSDDDSNQIWKKSQ